MHTSVERVEEAGRVPKVHVLIQKAVNNEQVAIQLARVGHNARDFVPRRILLREAHVALRVARVWET
jgi:hypothetical protein